MTSFRSESRCWLSALLIFITFSVQGQHHEIDSLEKILSSKTDTARVPILLRLSELYQNVDIGKSLTLAEQARDLANQTSYSKGEFEALFRINVIHYRKGDKELPIAGP